jgi:hypothetical protein
MQLYTELGTKMAKVSCRGGKRPCDLPTCGKTLEEDSRFYCSQCKIVVYCDAVCQKQHWKQHKDECLLVSTNPNIKEILKQRKMMHSILATSIGFVAQLFKIHDKPGIVVCDMNLTVTVSTKDQLHLKLKFLPFTEMVIGKTTTDTQLEFMKEQVALGRRVFGMLLDDCVVQCTSYVETIN